MNGNGFPTWVKVVAQVGFPIAVVIWLAAYITPMVTRTAEAMQQHLSDQETAIVLLRAICRNTAKTELAASFCDFGRNSF